MANRTFRTDTWLWEAQAKRQSYVAVPINEYLKNVQKQIDAELSGCWRCSGRQQGICDCCSHKAAADELEKLLVNVRTLTKRGNHEEDNSD